MMGNRRERSTTMAPALTAGEWPVAGQKSEITLDKVSSFNSYRGAGIVITKGKVTDFLKVTLGKGSAISREEI
jgi:hypothetical protein